MYQLPKPEIVRCFFDKSFEPSLPAMELLWDNEAPGVADRVWYLPEGVCLRGPAPERFGLTLYRQSPNAYQLRVIWNGMCLSWDHLSRAQIMATSLSMVLNALETDLFYLLDQPVGENVSPSLCAA